MPDPTIPRTGNLRRLPSGAGPEVLARTLDYHDMPTAPLTEHGLPRGPRPAQPVQGRDQPRPLGNGDIEVGLSKIEDLPYIIGLAHQAFVKQMDDGEGAT